MLESHEVDITAIVRGTGIIETMVHTGLELAKPKEGDWERSRVFFVRGLLDRRDSGA